MVHHGSNNVWMAKHQILYKFYMNCDVFQETYVLSEAKY